MTDERDEIVTLWQTQPTDDFRMSPAEIRRRADELHKQLRARTRGGYIVTGGVLLWTVWMLAISTHPALTVAVVLTMIGTAYLAWQVWQNRSTLHDHGTGEIPSIAHLRMELARQRDFHWGKTFWTRMAVFAPGALLLPAGFALALPHQAGLMAIETIVMVALLIAAIPLNRFMAKKYERQIEEIDRLQEEQ